MAPHLARGISELENNSECSQFRNQTSRMHLTKYQGCIFSQGIEQPDGSITFEVLFPDGAQAREKIEAWLVGKHSLTQLGFWGCGWFGHGTKNQF